LYLVIILSYGLRFALAKRDITYLGAIPIIYLIEHGSYSLGFLKGLFTL
jgi:hypothetical protein